MTNTHITLGGHKITTNKVGQVHTVTSFTGSFTGTMYYSVTNGICVVSLLGLKPSATGMGQVVYNQMPKAKQYGSVTTADNSNACYINPNTVSLLYNSNNTNAQFCQLIYPVADDWVES